MSLSPTDICNLALARVGHRDGNPLLDYSSDPTKAGRLCRLMYPINVEATLRAHRWNFAIKRATLAKLSAAPTYGYSSAFQLPVDFLRLAYTQDEEQGYDDDYRIEGRTLLANADTYAIEYVANITDSTQFDAMFADAVATRLAADLCTPLTDNGTQAEKLMQQFMAKIAEARNADAQEGTARGFYATEWEKARY